jgi:hypothetical protein
MSLSGQEEDVVVEFRAAPASASDSTAVRAAVAEVEGLADFATIAPRGMRLCMCSARGAASHSYYYEVECITGSTPGGVVQCGWATRPFRIDPGLGEGVGDDAAEAASWALDCKRARCLHGGLGEVEEAAEDGPVAAADADAAVSVPEQYVSYGVPVENDGDVVGCFLTLSSADATASMSFSVNGRRFPAAFSFPVASVKCPDGGACAACKCPFFFPCASLEEGEIIRVNLGDAAFVYPPGSDESDGDAEVATKKRKSKPVRTQPAVAPVATCRSSVSLRSDRFSADAFASSFHVRLPLAPAVGEEPPVQVTVAADKKAAIPTEQAVINRTPIAVAAPAASVTAPAPASPPVLSSVAEPVPVDETPEFYPVEDWDAVESIAELHERSYTMEQLKEELVQRGLKAGGTWDERAERLVAVRGLGSAADVPAKLRAPKGFPGPWWAEHKKS